MAKGQKRSTRELKKPKQNKAPAPVPMAPGKANFASMGGAKKKG